MKKRAFLLLAALSTVVVIVIAAVRWKDLAVRFQVFRLSGKPQLQDAWLERPADSIEGRAARTYFRERPAELIRGFLRCLRVACERQNGVRPPAELKDLEGQDRVTITLWKPKVQEDGQIEDMRLLVELQLERKDREAGSIDSFVFHKDGQPVLALQSLSELLKAPDGKGVEAVAGYPGWRFNTLFEDFEGGLSVGIRGRHGGWTTPGDDIEMLGTAWTGSELFLLGWPYGAALDPMSGKWRAIRGIPRRTQRGPVCVLRWDDGRILVASNSTTGTIGFDFYRIDQDAWEVIGQASELLGQPAEGGKDQYFEILGGAVLGAEALVFVQSGHPGSPVRGLRMDPLGRVAPISVLNISRSLFSGSAIQTFGSKIFFWSHSNAGKNRGAVWDGDADRWEPLPDGGLGSRPRLSFSHVKAGEEVIIFGGEGDEGNVDDAIAFSMPERSWRQVRVPPAARIGGNPAAGWTGREAWIWQGDGPDQPDPANAGLLDIATGAWKPFPAGGPSPRRSPRSAWTGEEILFLGGQSNDGRTFYRDVWAFNLSTSAWRRLDNIPRSRQEAGLTEPAGRAGAASRMPPRGR